MSRIEPHSNGEWINEPDFPSEQTGPLSEGESPQNGTMASGEQGGVEQGCGEGTSGQLPDRIDAGDGHGDYVYKRRGPFGRLRARGHRLVEVWLMNAVPRDADRPPQPGTATYTLVGTWGRKVATFTVALIAAVVMAAIVLMRL